MTGMLNSPWSLYQIWSPWPYLFQRYDDGAKNLTRISCHWKNTARRTAAWQTCDKLATDLSWQRFVSTVVNVQLPQLHLMHPTCIWRLRWRWPRLIFAAIFGTRKRESQTIVWCCLHDPTFSHFSKTLISDLRQMDGRTADRHRQMVLDRHMMTANTHAS